MTRNKRLFAGVFSLALLCAMFLTSCPEPEPENGEKGDPYSAAKPMITQQSETKRYFTNAVGTIGPLSVTATVTDGGDLTYQWYSVDTATNTGGTEIADETSATYTPPAHTGGGEYSDYYYVVVTNTKTFQNGEVEEVRTAETTSAPIGIIVLSSLPTVVDTITVTTTQNQYVRGFGGMSNAFAIGAPARYMQMADIETMFKPETGLGLKFLRIMLWPDKFQEIVSGQVEPQMGNAATYLPAVRKVNEYGGYVLASPWTAPAHMKTNESLSAGGSLKTGSYVDYAAHLRSFAENMAGASPPAPIYAISIQNEPSLKVSYDGMEWTEDEHRNFLRDNGSFTRAPQPVKGWGGGKEQPYVKVVSGEPHQPATWYNNAMDRVIANSAALANMDIAAYHLYGAVGSKEIITRNGTLNKETWMTEYNINSQNDAGYYQDSTWNYVWVFAETIHQTIGINNSSAFIWWYLKRFYGVVGDGSYGTVNGAVMPRGYVLSHYAKYATDTVRVNATTTHPGGADIRLTAFERKSTKSSAVEQEVMAANENSYSVVIYDKRTSGGAATTLRINLPAGFTASKVYGIISDPNQRHAPLEVILNPNGDSADITLPVNAIISVKFVQ